MVRQLLLCILLILFLSACASRNIVQQPSLSFDLNSQQNKAEEANVELMVKPIHSIKDLESYYDDDVIKYGVLPVQIYLQNKSDSSYLFSTDGVNLIDGTGTRVPAMSVDQTFEKIKKSQWRSAGWAVATGVLAVFSVNNVYQINKQIKADISSRTMKGGNLIPGSATEGTLYFSVSPEISTLDNWKLSLLLKDANGNIKTLTYNLLGNIEKRPTPEPPSETE